MSCIPIDDFSLISLCDATKVEKLYSIVPDDGSGEFDFARNSGATYVGADGLIKNAAINEPRIEFNPDGSYKGLLVEKTATNKVLHSNEFNNSSWTKQRINTSNTPQWLNLFNPLTGQNDLTKLIANTDFGQHRIFSNSVTYSSSFIFQITARKGELTELLLFALEGNVRISETLFDLESKSVISGPGFIANSVGDFVTCCILVPAGTYLLFISLAKNGVDGFIGNNVEGLFIFQAQASDTTTASSYIPTTTSAVTRVADILSNDISALVTGAYSMLLDVESNLGRLKVFESLT